MRHRRNARPNENEIPTVRIRRAIRSLQGLLSNPRRRKSRKKGKARRVVRRAKKSRRVARRARAVRPPKGKRSGSFFKRNKRWFRVTRIKVRVGRRKVSRRVARKSTFRAAQRARK